MSEQDDKCWCGNVDKCRCYIAGYGDAEADTSERVAAATERAAKEPELVLMKQTKGRGEIWTNVEVAILAANIARAIREQE